MFVFDHAASLWLRPDGTPDPSRPVLLPDGPLELGVLRASARLDVTVDGRPLPAGTGRWDGRRDYVTTGAGPGFEYESRVRFGERGVTLECLVTDMDGEPAPILRLRGAAEGEGWATTSRPGPDGRAQPAWRTVLTVPRPVSAVPAASRAAVPDPAPRIVVHGPSQDAQALVRLEHQLGSDTPTRYSALRPFGSTDERYSGRVFWDADLWMLPALALTHPAQARAIPEFRMQTFQGAREEYAAWLKAGRPTGQDADGTLRKMGHLANAPPGLKVPWETGPDGLELCATDGRWAHHATADAAWGMRYAAMLGLAPKSAAAEYARLAAGFLSARATRLSSGRFSIVDTLSPDENVHAEHDSYTNLAAELVMRWGGFQPGEPELPRQGGRLLNFSSDRGGRLNQQALLLAVWPWESGRALSEAADILGSCRGRENPDGPAMSLSIEALVEARHGDPERALAVWRESFNRYEHGPQRLLGESRNRPDGVFRTGVAGCWSAVLYGFLGVNVGDTAVPDAPWRRRLASGAWVSVRPRLPKAWTRVDIRIVLDGEPVWLSASHSGVARVQGPDVQARKAAFRR